MGYLIFFGGGLLLTSTIGWFARDTLFGVVLFGLWSASIMVSAKLFSGSWDALSSAHRQEDRSP
jgi:hypothetical protein